MTFLGLCPPCLWSCACLQYLSEFLQEREDKLQWTAQGEFNKGVGRCRQVIRAHEDSCGILEWSATLTAPCQWKGGRELATGIWKWKLLSEEGCLAGLWSSVEDRPQWSCRMGAWRINIQASLHSFLLVSYWFSPLAEPNQKPSVQSTQVGVPGLREEENRSGKANKRYPLH